MLDFTKLMTQLDRFGQVLAQEAVASRQRLDRVEQLFQEALQDPQYWTQQHQTWRDRLGFMAAEPLEPLDTAISIFDADTFPEIHTVLSTDGSQIAPSHHEIAFCYLLNIGRVALHYGITDVKGDRFRRVELKDSVRWGLLGKGAVLMAAAYPNRTSPVLRGKWVLDRILGQPPSPPPPDIPSIDPDIRGATTIRQQLDKHRNTPACAACHKAIDPPGFALENFDVIGGWRDFYRGTKPTRAGLVELANYPGRKIMRGLDVEQGGEMPDGRPFKNIDEYKHRLLTDKDQLVRNVAQKLLIYATGAELQFADREVVEQLVAQSRAKNYGFRSLLHDVVQSRVFLHK